MKKILVTFACIAMTANGVLQASERPAGFPSLDEMAGDWIPMRDVANPPAVHNFHDMLIVDFDLTSFSCSPGDFLWYTKPEKIYPPVKLLIGGKEYSSTDCRWYPYRAMRRNPDCGGLAVETDTRMINEQSAVLCRIRVSNPGATECKTTLQLEVPGRLHTNGVTAMYTFLNARKKKTFVTAVCPVQKPDSAGVEAGKVSLTWSVVLKPGAEQLLEFVAGHGDEKDVEDVEPRVAGWAGKFGAEFDGFKRCWEQRWTDTFTPGNKHFSGNLPVLATDNVALKRNYYMGAVTMLALERTQFAVHPRSFVTSGERGPGTLYYWDSSMQAIAWALIEPEGMKATLRRWLVQNMRSGCVINLNTTNGFDRVKHDQITGYAFNACTIFSSTFDYIRVNHDTAFLDEKLENGKTVLACLDEVATDWKTLVLPDSPLADYGGNGRLLECAPEYINRVPSANAQNVLMMRQLALLYDMRGNATRANELRGEATGFLPAVLGLYKPGDGVWYGLHKDGKRAELRHCVDYIYVGNALAGDLTPVMKQEMTAFVKRELFMRDWMRAMSQKDEAAAHSNRPDHGPMGAYDGWIPLTVGAMWRLGFPQDALEFYCRTAVVTKEGPFAQAREFYGPDGADHDAPVRVAYRGGCLKECISGAAFSDVVINTFFGFSPSLDGKAMIADPATSRPFKGTLSGVRYGDKLYNFSAGEKGVEIK